jgi:hypothetical protein
MASLARCSDALLRVMIAKLLALLALLSLTAFLRDSPHSRAIGAGCPSTQKLGIFKHLVKVF